MANPQQDASHRKVAPGIMRRTGTVDERFQSYNVEMVEVIGGRFWKPYSKEIDAILKARASQAPASETGSDADPVGMDPALFQQRPPVDLTNPRLRKLASALEPAYVRVSGTWANMVYFHDSDAPPPPTPPRGFGGVLTRQQWKGVVDFARAVGAKIVTSFSTGEGTRDSGGVWTSDQARRFLDYTHSIGGEIAAAEYMNEPTAAAMGGAPAGYDAAAFARDFALFHDFMRRAAPNTMILGPGSVGEGLPSSMFPASAPFIKTADMLSAIQSLGVTPPIFDAFSYHFYGAVSNRCAATMPGMGTTEEAALSEEWLSRTETVEAFYEALRDKFVPGAPMWNTETADAACGGNSWASTFLDSFRYVEQLGRLARRGVQVVMHNTLAASDYGLLDETSLAPRPNYWAAVLWRKLMGTVVLDAGLSPAPGLHLFAHSLRAVPGGVALLVVNTDRSASATLDLPVESERYALTARDPLSTSVELNGRELQVGPDGSLPALEGESTPRGKLTFAPSSITFLALPGANNENCR